MFFHGRQQAYTDPRFSISHFGGHRLSHLLNAAVQLTGYKRKRTVHKHNCTCHWICRVLETVSNAILVLRQFYGFKEGTFTNIKQTYNLINFLSVCFESGYNQVIFLLTFLNMYY